MKQFLILLGILLIVCHDTRNTRGRSQSFVPIVIQNELASGPADVDELSRRIPRCRRLLIYYLNKMVKDGILEKVVNLKNLRKPVYRLKVK